jgi:hypothetical protein
VIFSLSEAVNWLTPNIRQPDTLAATASSSSGQGELTPTVSIASKYADPVCEPDMLEAPIVAHMVHALAHLPPSVPNTIYADYQNTAQWWGTLAIASLEREYYAR